MVAWLLPWTSSETSFLHYRDKGGNEDEKMVRSNYDGGSDRSCYIGKLPYWLINRNEETPLVSSGVFS
ncbi:hypothetical protein [Brevibacillus panacihumi]|uniref:hypothetical protein n=1 Tax=Brevibacillus panacihumi TaxID=497735 RepID=UPI003D1FC28B